MLKIKDNVDLKELEKLYLQVDKHKEDMLKSDVKCGLRNYAYYSEMISDLYRQLQTYKDKEDKLREFLNNEPNDLYSTKPTKKYWVIDILQILNDKVVE